MFENPLKRKEGFTIVEVMIVLAIAALIILIVLVAVPALQRNSRNTQLDKDVSLAGAVVNECMNAHMGRASYCNTDSQLLPYFDMSKFKQIEEITVGTSMPEAYGTAHVAFGKTCNSDNSALSEAGAGQGTVALLFKSESSSGEKVARCQGMR